MEHFTSSLILPLKGEGKKNYHFDKLSEQSIGVRKADRANGIDIMAYTIRVDFVKPFVVSLSNHERPRLGIRGRYFRVK